MSETEADGRVFAERSDRLSPRGPTPFAAFSTRLGCVAGDTFVALFTTTHVASTTGRDGLLNQFDARAATLVVLVIYFTACTASKMQGTPLQFINGMRIVDFAGRGLHFRHALGRSLIKVTLIAAACCLVGTAENPQLLWVAVPALTGMFLAAITPFNQALHDLLTGTVAAKRQALASPGQLTALRVLLERRGLRQWLPHRRLRFFALLNDAVIFALPLFLITFTASIAFERDLRARTNYALNETRGLQIAVEMFHDGTGSWPRDAGELGSGEPTPYPDGGYYQLDDGGRIRIQFEHKKR